MNEIFAARRPSKERWKAPIRCGTPLVGIDNLAIEERVFRALAAAQGWTCIPDIADLIIASDYEVRRIIRMCEARRTVESVQSAGRLRLYRRTNHT